MLQRIQTVYLSLVCLISMALFFLPLSLIETAPGMQNDAGKVQVTKVLTLPAVKESISGVTTNTSIPYVLIALNMVVGTMAACTIFLFRNRKRQMLFCRLNLVAICLLTGAIFFIEDQLNRSINGQITYLIGTYLPVIQLIMTYIAERAIKKDDDLVKSADRLR